MIMCSCKPPMELTVCYECKGRGEVMTKHLVGFTNVICPVCKGRCYLVDGQPAGQEVEG